MFKPLLIAAALTTFGAAGVYAQTAPPASRPAPTVQDRTVTPNPALTADTRKLIGRNVKNAQDQTIGEIESIYLDSQGRVAGVIIGVGGFLGMGERKVQLAWSDLTITNNGEKVTTAYTKDQLKAMPEFKYKEAAYRGQVWNDRGIYRDTTVPSTPPATTMDRTSPPPPRADAAPARPTKDFNADGYISTEAVLKASVRNANNDKIGEVEDVYVDQAGKIQTVVVSVGGFLGMGKKDVALKWGDLQTKRDGDTLVLLSGLDKDQLKAMPDYTYERQRAQQR
ncbi:MAG: PRC-barrel domain-containing protein [Alphaproteobacteria bacterium]|nr:PRC-barrel domain-containing protein [Alphaproteobacteria bacterium]